MSSPCIILRYISIDGNNNVDINDSLEEQSNSSRIYQTLQVIKVIIVIINFSTISWQILSANPWSEKLAL
jgi:hypothetical protein